MRRALGTRRAISKSLATIKNELLARDISYELFRMDENIGQLLQTFLKKRNRLI